ncbi:hypothetical protein BCR33DRAFT_715918 [Rhizoclosmatium globosum]|uniref:Uncharacterized protein n=1 Tax=Rhizoclosmatium globosum TaxID=329046 RepID=A0A1Y2CHU3_9FUNG|nr:hypothetical protein BCR33DRAFT_715918 [Rhizoclosmatium globosum]|eukprot:ORY45885.1 hypothetical protein BCR33DRAFT_715918 [Rhizoclosmatium globosum]
MDSTINDRINAASQRRESLDAEQAATLAAELRQWEAKEDRAQELKQQNIDQKREKAHASLDDVSGESFFAYLHAFL